MVEQPGLTSLLEPLTWVVFQLRLSLDTVEGDRFPRWVRVSRGRELRDAGRTVHSEHLGVLLAFLSDAVEVVLDLHEWARAEVDHRKKWAEDTLDAIDKLLAGPLGSWKVGPEDGSFDLDPLRRHLDPLRRALDLVPDSGDVDVLGRQLFWMLCVGQRPISRRPGSRAPDPREVPRSGVYIDAARTGRVRLMQWAYDRPFEVRGLGPRGQEEGVVRAVRRLGSRPLWQAPVEHLPGESTLSWAVDGDGSRTIQIFEHLHTEGEEREDLRNLDLAEVHSLLEALGYDSPALTDAQRRQFTPALALRLDQFQAMNGLTRSAELDEATLNRLMHLDTRTRTLRRAVPFDPTRLARLPPLPPQPEVLDIQTELRTELIRRELPIPAREGPRVSRLLPLVNADADHPRAEGIVVQLREAAPEQLLAAERTHGRPYSWYVCGAPIQQGRAAFPAGVARGWIQHAGEPSPWAKEETVTAGFVAMESRALLEGPPQRYHGGRHTEGAAAGGRLFFAARAAEPWVPGRAPGARRVNPLEVGGPPAGRPRAGMYQWVDVRELVSSLKEGESLLFTASALQRSRVREGGAGLPDQGRLVLGVARMSALTPHGPATPLTPGVLAAFKASAWWPASNPSTGYNTLADVVLAEDWVLRATPPLRLDWERSTDPVVAVLVGLYGLANQGEDIDAWFDDVTAWWDLRPTAELQEGGTAATPPGPVGDAPAPVPAPPPAPTSGGPRPPPGAAEAGVQLDGTRPLRVRVVPGPDGRPPLAEVRAQLISREGVVVDTADPDPEGWVELAPPAPGEWFVRVVPRPAGEEPR